MPIAQGEAWRYSTFRFIWLALLAITHLYLVVIKVSGVSSPLVDFYLLLITGVWGYFGVSWISHLLLGISIGPFGDYDPDTYPLQAWIGYTNTFIVSVFLGILAFIYFGNLVTTEHVIAFPVERVFETGWTGGVGTFQVVSNAAYSVGTGATPTLFALAHSLPATVVENPLIIYLPMVFAWIGVRYLLEKLFGVPTPIANAAGMLVWILVVPMIFSFSGHTFKYGGDEQAYARAGDYSFITSIPTALTGFPIVADVGHFSNNYHTAMEEINGRQTIYTRSPIRYTSGGTP